MATEVKLPEMGEGIASGDVVRLLVKAGDRVQEGQGLIELETDKALIEVPSDASGIVDKVNVKQGDKVKVGAVIVSLKGDEGSADDKADKDAKPGVNPVPAKAEQLKSDRKSDAAKEQETAQTEDEAEGMKPQQRNGLPKPRGKVVQADASANGSAAPNPQPVSPDSSSLSGGGDVPAGPATRRLAREFGLRLADVPGSGPGGRIYQADVIAYYKEQSVGAATGFASKPLPDFSKWGEVHVESLSNVRRKIAEQMAYCAATVAQVTQFERADITNLDDFRQRRETAFEKKGGKLTFTVLAIRAIATTLRTYPRFNASIDMARGEVVYKDYIHLGIAVDTERGLLVPVLRDADKKDLRELAAELPALAERARSGRVELAELQGASFTISNQGSIGGAEFTPIVNWPEVAILGIGRSRREPGVNPLTGAVEARLLCPLALSYDHRAVDGADAARFISLLKELLEDPERLLLGV